MNKTILLIGNGRLSSSLQPYLKQYNLIIFDENNINTLFNYQGDYLIDCSLKDSFQIIYKYLKAHPLPTIICSTSHSEGNIKKMKELSSSLPLLKEDNFSFGINLINKFLKDNKKSLEIYDKYIIDFHHKDKIDSPSGTSIKLASQIDNQTSLFSIRSHKIIGTHKIHLFSDDEEIEITHRITSRNVFARGIILGLEFIKNKPFGFYSMEDVINEI